VPILASLEWMAYKSNALSRKRGHSRHVGGGADGGHCRSREIAAQRRGGVKMKYKLRTQVKSETDYITKECPSDPS